MNDRELLELAAKAVEIPFKWSENGTSMTNVTANDAWVCWNPLADDGDALRLAVKLRMEISFSAAEHFWAMSAFDNHSGCGEKPANGDMAAAARRCIVRAAAAIAQQRAPITGSGEAGGGGT